MLVRSVAMIEAPSSYGGILVASSNTRWGFSHIAGSGDHQHAKIVKWAYPESAWPETLSGVSGLAARASEEPHLQQ